MKIALVLFASTILSCLVLIKATPSQMNDPTYLDLSDVQIDDVVPEDNDCICIARHLCKNLEGTIIDEVKCEGPQFACCVVTSPDYDQ